MLHRAECHGRAGGIAIADIVGNRYDQARWHVHQIAGKAVDMETHDAGNVLTQIIAAGTACLAGPASQRPIGDDPIAGAERVDAGTDPDNLPGSLNTDDQRQRALGKGHAAPAPNVDVVQPDRFDANLNFAAAGLAWRGNLAKFDFTVADERERAH